MTYHRSLRASQPVYGFDKWIEHPELRATIWPVYGFDKIAE